MDDLTPAEEREVTERHDFLNALEQGIPETSAAIMVGWSRTKYKRLLRDPGFNEAVQLAFDVRDEAIEAKVYEKALSGDKEMQKYWLNNRRPARWADRKQVDVQGEVKMPVSITVGVREGLKELLRLDRGQAAALGPGGVLDVQEVVPDVDDGA